MADNNNSNSSNNYGSDGSTLESGKYWRPPAEETSGFQGNPKKYHRAPCPALNSLANHGYLPRDGKNLTVSDIANACLNHYNLDYTTGYAVALLAKSFAGVLPWNSFTLADVGIHNGLEHDVSMFHYDFDSGKDPCIVAKERAEDLIKRSDGKSVTLENLLEFHKQIARDNFKAISSTQIDFSCTEISLLMNLLGRNESISVEHLRSFVIDEKIPDNFVKCETTVGAGYLSGTSNKAKPVVQAEQQQQNKSE